MKILNNRLYLKYFASSFTLKIMLGVACTGIPTTNTLADEIIYNDQSPDTILQNTPVFFYDQRTNALYAGTASNPVASNNKVLADFTDPKKKALSYVFGGLAQNSDSTNNTVEINAGNVSYGVIGGYSFGDGKAANNNTVTVNDGAIGNVYGGSSSGNRGIANNNTVTINGGTVGSIFGGFGDGNSGITNNNTVTINGGTVNSVYGSLGSKDANNNSVIVNGGNITSNVYGSSGSGGPNSSIMSGNTVKIFGGSVRNTIFGVWSTGENIEVSNNSIEISNGNLSGEIYGGYSYGYGPDNISTTKNNSVIFNGSETLSVSGYGVYGGFGYGIGPNSVTTVGNNSIIFNGSGVLGSDKEGYDGTEFYGGYGHAYDNNSKTIVDGNSVVLNGPQKINGNIYGGYGYANANSITGTSYATVTNNRVEMNDGEVSKNIYGGYSYGQSNGPGSSVTVSNNSVKISGGTVTNVYGGNSLEPNDASQYQRSYADITVTNNSVTLNGGKVSGDVYGGYGSGVTDVNVTNNLVTLIGENITIGGSIWGGRGYQSNVELTDFEKVVSGNTLNLVGYRGTVSGIYNFEHYNWTLPSNVVNGDVLVTIADGGTAVNLTNTKHTIADMQVSDNRLHTGDEITFISQSQGDWTSANYTIKQGQFIVYDATLSQKGGEDNPFVLTIGNREDIPTDNGGNTGGDTGSNDGNDNNNGNGNSDGQSGAKVNPQSKSYLEGRAAALGLVNQGNDLIATAGIDKIRVMVRSNDDEANRPPLIPFIISNGSYQSYKTGSHADIKAFNMAAGLATGFEFAQGHKATIGAFFEYGHGTYDTYNSFTNFTSVHGDGNANYKGGGVFGRIDFANTGLVRVSQLSPDQADGLYVEASFRAGQISNYFDVGRNAVVDGRNAGVYRGSYDSKVSYYGGHLAGGYVFNVDDKRSLETYGRYLWTYMDGDTVTIMNEKLHLQSSTSSRIQLGGRYAYAYNEQFKPYIGAAYEYEFDGDIKGKAYEFNLERPSLKGNIGVFEAGFDYHPIAANVMFSINMNGQLYVGQRQGGGGGVKIKYQY